MAIDGISIIDSNSAYDIYNIVADILEDENTPES